MLSKIIPLILAVLISVPGEAGAEGRGILIGESRLHLGIALETGWDTNVNYDDKGIGDVVLHIKPALRFDLPSEKVAFTFGGVLDVVRYFGVNSTPSINTVDFSTVQGNAFTELVVFPKSKFTLKLRDDFLRSSEPRSDIVGNFARTDNTAGVGFEYKPGNAFLFGTYYKFNFDFFDSGTGLGAANYFSHQPEMIARWNFLPKTGLVVSLTGNIYRYPNKWNIAGDDGVQYSVSNTDLNILKVMVGVSGMITQKLSATALVGYGNTLLQQSQPKPSAPTNWKPQSDFNSAIALARLDYGFSMQTKLGIGFTRDVQPSSYFGYFASNKFILDFKQGFLEKFWILLNVGCDLQYFGAPIMIARGGSTSRSDIYGTTRLELKYDIKEWVSISLYDSFELRSTNYRDAVGNTGYNKNVTIFQVNFMY